VAKYNKHEYRRASHQKFNAAANAHRAGHYTVSHYLSGVAVECMLRAYRWHIDPSWDAGHDLISLMKKSNVLSYLRAGEQARVRDNLNEMARRWSVSHRYAPDDRLEAYLGLKLKRTGSLVLLENSAEMNAMAQEILTECDKRCP
jgi:hypothetical protein